MPALCRILLLAVLASLLPPLTVSARAAWPERPITLIVPYPAGGGTDIVARTLAAILEKEIKAPVNVVNRAGGGGITGHEAIARATPDGYTLGMITNDLSFYKWQGLSNLTYADFMPIGQTNELAASVTVKFDAPYRTLADLVAAIKANPGKLKATGASPGASWHIGLMGLLASLKIDATSVVWVPSQGGTLGHQDVAAGGSDFSTSSLAEARALIEAKKIRTLAIMSDARHELFPDIPTLKEAVGTDWTFAVIHGVGGPVGLPKDVVDRLVAAVRKAHEVPEFRGTLTQRVFRVVHRAPAEYAAYLRGDFEKMGPLLKSLGLAK